MSSTESTTIDEKKAEDSGSTTDKADWKGFSIIFSSGLTGIFFGVVIIGSMGLFLAKVANANILPTDCNIEPYPLKDESSVTARDVAMEIIYMNPVKILGLFGLKFWGEPTETTYFIQEANFVNSDAKLNFMNDFKNSWLCTLKNKAYPPVDPTNTDPIPDINGYINPIKPKPDNSPFWAYEFETMKSMTCASFSIINKVFFYMNYLPEWATMFLFALFFSLIIPLIFFVNIVYGFGYHILNFGELIKNLYNFEDFNKESNNRDKTLPFYKKWSTITNILYLIAYFIGALYSFAFGSVIVTTYTFLKALGANYVVRDKNFDPKNQKPEDAPKLNIFSFIKSSLYYKKTFIIILVMLNLMGTTNEYLGTSYLPGVIIALLILIFGLKILNTENPEKLYSVLDPNFPNLSLPILDLRTSMKPVEICKEEAEFPINKAEVKKTVTGFWSNSVLNNSTTQEIIQAGGGIKRTVIQNAQKPKPKTKTKIYNLKLV